MKKFHFTRRGFFFTYITYLLAGVTPGDLEQITLLAKETSRKDIKIWKFLIHMIAWGLEPGYMYIRGRTLFTQVCYCKRVLY